jgi:hypothetical protein
MKPTNLLVLLLFFFTESSLWAQRYEREHFPRRSQVVSVEVLGSGGRSSVNYSRVLGSWKNVFVNAKAGLGTNGIPVAVNLNFGGGNHYAYAGVVGKLSYFKMTPYDSPPQYGRVYSYPVFGYKLHPRNTRFYMDIHYITYRYRRAHQNPYETAPLPTGRWHWFGAGVGYAFK